jgi:hypothetical protein
MRWRHPLIVTAVSIILILIGFLYGVIRVGIPSQDPSPAIAAAEARDVGISSWGIFAGTCLLLVSLAWLAVIGIIKGVKRASLV